MTIFVVATLSHIKLPIFTTSCWVKVVYLPGGGEGLRLTKV